MRPPIDPPLVVSPFDDDEGSDQKEKILKKYEPYIRSLVRKQLPHDLVHPDLLDLAIDDVVAEALVKFWFALQGSCITSFGAYIRRIVHSVIVDMIRKHEPTQPLPVDEDGELYQGVVIATPGEGMRDPAYEVEQKEFVATCLVETVDDVLALPPCQRRAMICSLKDQIDDILLLIEAFRTRDVNIEMVDWPEEKDEVQKWRVSLSIARKKLRTSLSPRTFSE